MKEEVFGKVTEYIEAIATNLGVAAEHVYELLVRQQVISGITTIVTLLLIWTVLSLILVILSKKQMSDSYGLTGCGIAMIYLGILTGITVIVGIIFMLESINQIINPEYYAIREIMGVFKGGN